MRHSALRPDSPDTTHAGCRVPTSGCFRRAAGALTIGGVDRTEPAVQRPALVLGVLSASILLDALDLSITQVALRGGWQREPAGTEGPRGLVGAVRQFFAD